jgi:hypothetical protein
MTTLNRVLVQWSGPQVVGSAVNVLAYDGSDNAAPPLAAIRAAYQGLAPFLPTGLSIAFPNTGDRFEDTTGNLTGFWSAAAVGNVVGSAPAATAAGAGACAAWSTGAVVRTRRLRGRTFLVPLATNAYDTDGTLVAGAMTVLSAWVTAMLASGPLFVWSRPTTDPVAPGTSSGVQSGRVKDKVAFLSSRRD